MRFFSSLAGSAILAAGLAIAPVHADTGADLIKAKGCLVCHTVGAPMIGPSFRDISHRFHGLNNARAMLARVAVSGGDAPGLVYHWGTVRMPNDIAKTPVNEEEAGMMADYILSLK
jgi:cytochrome c